MKREFSTAAAWGLVGIAVIGLIINQTANVSLLTGDSQAWIGFALAAAIGVAALIIPGVPRWVKVTVCVIAFLALAQCIRDQMWLSQQRDKFNEIVNNFP